ncbi:hypothetical protein VULLAG_LOCUS22972 [Vulpes lagopus]
MGSDTDTLQSKKMGAGPPGANFLPPTIPSPQEMEK